MTLIRNTPVQDRSRARLEAINSAVRSLVTDPDIGRDRFTTAQVADMAGCSIGTVYRYYPDRYAMLEALFPDRDRAEEVLGFVKDALTETAEQNPRARIRNAMHSIEEWENPQSGSVEAEAPAQT